MKQSEKLLNNLQAVFVQHKNLENAHIQQAYMKSELPFWGIPKPEVKIFCNTIFKNYKPTTNSEYKENILYLFEHATYREEWYTGLYYASKFPQFITEDNIDAYLSIVKITQWWDIVDTLAANIIGVALKNSPNLKSYLKKWIKDKNMWVRRTALLAQLRYKNDTNFALLSQLIETVMHEKEFFIRKAIGWALREYSKTNPQEVLHFVEKYKNTLSGLSIREGTRLIKR